jgi:cytoskeletal protein RodZ
MKRMGRGCLIVFGVLIVLGVIGQLVGGGRNQATTNTESQPTVVATQPAVAEAGSDTSSDAPAAEPTTAPTEAPAAEPTAAPTEAPAAYTVGQDVQVGDVRWKILEATDAGQTLESDNEFIKDKQTQGKFIRLRLEVENLSKEQLNFSEVELVDNQERAFKSSTDVEVMMHVPTEEQCPFFQQLTSNLPKTCQIMYEVPADAQGIKIKVGDLEMMGSDEALIEAGF